MNHNTIFLTEVFEDEPQFVESPKVLFSTRLWPNDPKLSKALNEERDFINAMRVSIVKNLKEIYKENYIGGLYDTELARQLAPELILPSSLTIKKNYLQLLHKSDIGIGTMGLHESIGGGTGEYVAASKAIVQETLHYSVPGNFQDGVNYLSFSNVVECLAAVDKLFTSPEELYKMKCNNKGYYESYLKPESIVKNSLNLVENL